MLPGAVQADDLENLIRLQTPQYVPADTSVSRSRPAGRSDADDLIGSAMGLLGVAYRYGGTSSRTGFDCSGFMQHIFSRSMQISLPRTSADQAREGEYVSRSSLLPGDMVFFRTMGGSRISHVGLYIGNDRFIHAPRAGKRIEIASLNNKYWKTKYATARRIKKNDPSRFLN
ncbi:C40 family peptidase [Neisseria musculi]|uniref:NlpC/P60 family protein n=1 Tax=Neisseria musculi TaxID=1815583 RepID=A0A7H1MBT4_9NEIS|nr:C40 family peptidase [Neisseria musculi]QNT59099.1 nlpC/P60 family protein [Neisseria musculi]